MRTGKTCGGICWASSALRGPRVGEVHLAPLLVAGAYAESGLDYKPRYTPVVRALARGGPSRIKDIATGMGVSHSAVSQTVSALARAKWVTLKPGADSRERIVHLTPYAKARLPQLEQQWTRTARAAASLDRDIGLSLEEVLRDALAVLQRQSFAERIKAADKG